MSAPATKKRAAAMLAEAVLTTRVTAPALATDLAEVIDGVTIMLGAASLPSLASLTVRKPRVSCVKMPKERAYAWADMLVRYAYDMLAPSLRQPLPIDSQRSDAFSAGMQIALAGTAALGAEYDEDGELPVVDAEGLALLKKWSAS